MVLVVRSWLGVAVVILCVVSFVVSSQAQDDVAEAEKVAKSYMTALFNGDVQTAAKLAHTKTLEDLKQKYLKDLDKATQEGRERQFLRETGVDASAREVRAMSGREIFVTLMEGSIRMGGDQGKPKNGVKVTVDSSKKSGRNQVIVSLKAVIPTEKGPVNKTGELLLSKEGGQWRVLATKK